MATPEEIIAMNEAEQQRLAAAGLGGIGSKTVTPAPALAPSANAYVAPEIPQITALSTPPPIEPAPTLGDGQVSAANELLGNAAHDASLGTVAGDPTVSPAVAATSQAADQANANIQAKAEPTGAAFAEAVFGDPKPAQSQAPVDPNDPYAADRNRLEKDGVKAIDESFKIEMGAATRDDRHLNPETGEMDPGGNNILDVEEMAAHVSSIESAWREADEGIKARVALDYKNNLEKLQEEQHRIKAQYSAMVDEVANTYINPAELWDKGGFGARIGIPGAAALDTFFAMKGWNVPSFSAQWDKAVEGNVIAQKSKLTQKTGKLAGFEKLWDMAGQIATNEKEQIAYTSDLLKATTMGQYVHQLAPFKSLAAAADAQAMKADAMRKIGKMMMDQVNNMDQMALRRKTQADADALARLKYELEAEKLRRLKGAKDTGAGVGNSNFASKNLGASWKHMGSWDAVNITPKDAARHAKMFGQGVPGQQSAVLNKLMGVKKGNWTPVEGLKNGKRVVIGFYDTESTSPGQNKDDVALLRQYLDDSETIGRFNETYVRAVKEAIAEGDTSFSVGGTAEMFMAKLKGQAGLTGARAELAAMVAEKTLEELHRLSGGAVTEGEAVRFNNLMPAIAVDKSGVIRTDVSRAMRDIVLKSERKTSQMNQATGAFFPTQAPPADLDSEEGKAWVAERGSAKASIDILAAGIPGTYLQPTDIGTGAGVADGLGKKPVKLDAKDSALQPRGTILPDGTFGVTYAVNEGTTAAFIAMENGTPYEQLSPQERASADKLKVLPGQKEAEVARVWAEDKGGWKNVVTLMKASRAELASLRDKLPVEKRAKVKLAMEELRRLGNEASVMEEQMRESAEKKAGKPRAVLEALGESTYDHTLSERPESTNHRDRLAAEYRTILGTVYGDATQATEGTK